MGNGSPLISSTTIATCFGGSTGRAPAPIHSAALMSNCNDLPGGVTLRAYSLASIPCGNFTRKHSMPYRCNFSASRVAARSPGIVPVVSQIHPARLVVAQRLQQFVGKTFRAVNAGDVFQAVHPKRQGINHRFTTG